jgi:hypothetical protein
VITQSIGLVGIIEQNQPPISGGWLSSLGQDAELGIHPPYGTEVIGHLLLQSGDDRHDIRIGQNGALVDHRDLDGGSLSVGRLQHRGDLLGKEFGERAA